VILDAASSILYFHFFSYHFLCHFSISALVFLVVALTSVSTFMLFFTILSYGIRCKWPNQLSLCAFMWSIIFICLVNSSNSSFVLILHGQSLSFVGPKILLNTFLSNTINLFFIVSFKTHASRAYVTIGLIILQYNFNFDFLETNRLLKKNWLV